MQVTLPQAKHDGQEKLCYREIDIRVAGGKDARMRDDHGAGLPRLYILEWTRSYGWTRRELAKLSGVSEAYISQLISGKKANPSQRKLDVIAKALNIPLYRLYSPPPSSSALAEIQNIPLDQLERILRQRRAG